MRQLANELAFYHTATKDGAGRLASHPDFDPTVVNEWFIVDDVIDERGHEGFVLMFGNPFSAVGFSEGSFKFQREAVYRAVLRHNADAIYRVYLERRHGKAARCSDSLGGYHGNHSNSGLRSRVARCRRLARAAPQPVP